MKRKLRAKILKMGMLTKHPLQNFTKGPIIVPFELFARLALHRII